MDKLVGALPRFCALRAVLFNALHDQFIDEHKSLETPSIAFSTKLLLTDNSPLILAHT
jgi:hypothetical protein